MNLHVVCLVAVFAACALAAAPAKKSASEKVTTDLKPKREAAVLSGNSYHGPSYKYLPPSSSASAGGYDSYSGGHHSSYAGAGAYDFAASSGGSVHGVGHLEATAPKVETYIVHTQSGHGDQAAPQGGVAYKYAGPSASFGGGYSGHQSSLESELQSGSSASFGSGYSGHQSSLESELQSGSSASFGGGYSGHQSSLGSGHQSGSSASFGSGYSGHQSSLGSGHQSGSSASFGSGYSGHQSSLGSGHQSGSSASYGGGYSGHESSLESGLQSGSSASYGGGYSGHQSSLGSGHQSGSSASFGSGYSGHQSSLGSGHQSGFSSGYSHGQGAVHKVKAIVVPTRGFSASSHGGSGYGRFGGSSLSSLGYSKGLSGGSHYFSGSAGNHIGDSYSGDSYTNKHAGFSGGYSGAQSIGIGASVAHGYQINHGSSIPVHSSAASYRDSSYTGSQGGGYAYETPVSSYSHSSHGAPSNSYGEAAASHVQQSPSYAAGHKGLGHFSYAPSTPQALHTDYVDSNIYDNSYASHASHSSTHIAAKAPFKPSVFLGTSHESGSAVSSEYGAPAQSHAISTQYLPPTSDGYDYPSPAALYDAPSHSHSSAESGSAQEPDSSYLPPSQPQTSYGPPSTPDNSYLPPHH